MVISNEKIEKIISRIKKIGNTNLLWNWAPTTGDLGILEQPNLDKRAFCGAFIDLLYGPGQSPERLERYLNFVKSQSLPNKWTFPNYFCIPLLPSGHTGLSRVVVEYIPEVAGQRDRLQLACMHKITAGERRKAQQKAACQRPEAQRPRGRSDAGSEGSRGPQAAISSFSGQLLPPWH